MGQARTAWHTHPLGQSATVSTSPASSTEHGDPMPHL